MYLRFVKCACDCTVQVEGSQPAHGLAHGAQAQLGNVRSGAGQAGRVARTRTVASPQPHASAVSTRTLDLLGQMTDTY